MPKPVSLLQREVLADLARTQTALIKQSHTRAEYGRPYFLPPEVPPERVRALRRAFDATMKEPAFIADAARLQLDIDPMTGEEVQALVAQLARTPPAIVTRVRTALEAPAAR